MNKAARFMALCASLVWLVAAATIGTDKAPTKTVDFNRDVRPTLTKCFTCHGPDTGEGAAGLRLDEFATAIKKLESGAQAIVPGHPEQSELIARINAADDSVMPPASSHKTLSPEEKETLRRWIAEGAEYKVHWAFVRPARSPLPEVKDKAWARNGIDRYVLARLESAGLNPEPEADRETLIRRVSLDITGLPPTVEEVDAFVNDRSSNAYEKVVDRLLASKRYGERMAMDWMDYSRYADSNGYQADYERYQSRWRDWVINAFNTNMPYDRFSIEQVAGDMLPNATMEQRLATGFNRNHRINTEGGVIAEEWRVEGVIDRMETTSAIWLGLTAGCARCHDHKYDPIKQKDFYRMYAYYNSVPESGTGEERPVNHPPLLQAPTPEQSAMIKAAEAKIAGLKKYVAKKVAAKERVAQTWHVESEVPVVTDGLVKRLELTAESAHFKTVGNPVFAPGRATGSAKVSETDYLDLGDFGDFDSTQSFSFGAWINPEKGEGSVLSRMDTKGAYQGWEFSLSDRYPQAHLISKWTEDAIKVVSKERVPLNQWSHVFLTYDGGMKAAGFRLYVNGRQVETSVPNDTLKGTIRTKVGVKVGRRTDGDFYFGLVDDVAVFDRELSPSEVALLASTDPAITLLAIPPDQRTKEVRQEIARYWWRANDPVFKAKDDELAQTIKEKEAVEAKVSTVMVMEEMPQPRETFVLERGQYDKHGEKVEPGTPTFLPPLPKGAPNNRLGFASWLVSRENPLAARVQVNRLWERFFGTGIVATVEDFGTRAEFPSHPELLDYLAVEFMEGGWDLKAIIKKIVTSASYRQSSSISDAKRKADPENRLISRGPRFRLPGEVIRDQALFASGLLKEKIGGPSVYPYMPDGVWDETNFYGNLRNYKHDTGEGAYRRSLYTIWKRTAAPPNMLLFDVPSRETCRVRRARTDTPLQALVLMNDETYLEASRVLAERMLREGGDTPESRLTHGFRLVLARRPTRQEVQVLSRSLIQRIERFKKDPEGALALISTGEARIPLRLDRAEMAAYTVAASTLLNLDETVTKE